MVWFVLPILLLNSILLSTSILLLTSIISLLDRVSFRQNLRAMNFPHFTPSDGSHISQLITTTRTGILIIDFGSYHMFLRSSYVSLVLCPLSPSFASPMSSCLFHRFFSASTDGSGEIV